MPSRGVAPGVRSDLRSTAWSSRLQQPSADREIAASQDLEILYEAIENLPPKCRQVFLLSRAQRMTYPQIAVHCGISVKMVEKHICHALAICMKKVGEGEHITS